MSRDEVNLIKLNAQQKITIQDNEYSKIQQKFNKQEEIKKICQTYKANKNSYDNCLDAKASQDVFDYFKNYTEYENECVKKHNFNSYYFIMNCN